MVPKTYATLVTSDAYAMGVEALVYSLLKVRARFPVLVLYTPQVTQPAVDKLTRFFHTFATRLEVQMTRVDDIGIPSQVTDTRAVHVAGWVNSGYTKLHIFRLEQFETIVYIDADAVVLENVDEVCFDTCLFVINCYLILSWLLLFVFVLHEELFERDTTFAAAPDVFPPDRFNAGVLVIKPSVALFDELMRKAQELASYDGGDTGFLNAFFPNWYQGDGASRLPFGYNAQRTMYWLVNEKNPGYWNAIKPLKILHYSSNPKPWEDPSRKGDLEMLWWQIYTESRCVGF